MSHELKLRRIKPFGAWQAVCGCGRFESATEMSQDKAIAHHNVHVARVTGTGWPERRAARGDEPPVILMCEARPAGRGSRVLVADVDRLMARLVGPVLFVVTGWWLLTAGGAL